MKQSIRQYQCATIIGPIIKMTSKRDGFFSKPIKQKIRFSPAEIKKLVVLRNKGFANEICNSPLWGM